MACPGKQPHLRSPTTLVRSRHKAEYTHSRIGLRQPPAELRRQAQCCAHKCLVHVVVGHQQQPGMVLHGACHVACDDVLSPTTVTTTQSNDPAVSSMVVASLVHHVVHRSLRPSCQASHCGD